MNYHKISRWDTANGLGIGSVLWVSGCEWHCPGCHNADTWDVCSGKPFTEDSLKELLESVSNPHVRRVTISGGDPMHPSNRAEVASIVKSVKTMYLEKNVWLYTGYSFEAIKDSPVLEWVDVLVDGRFVMGLKDISLPFCGSSNQRVIDIPKTFDCGEVVLLDVY